MGASTLTPVELRNFAGRIQGQSPHLPQSQAQTAIAGLNALASAMEQPVPVDPPPSPLDPRIAFRNFTFPQFFGVAGPHIQSGGIWRPDYLGNSNGALAYYAFNRFGSEGEITRCEVVAVEFIAPPSGYRGYFDRSNMGKTAPAEISDSKGRFTSACRTDSLGWTTIPGDTTPKHAHLIPGRKYWLQVINAKRDALIAGRLEPILNSAGVPQPYGMAAFKCVVSARP